MVILIVDDELSILQTTSMALKTMGHEVFTAENSKQARERLNSEPIDAMFLDLMLGNENGIDFLEALKQEGDKTPVIVFTAHSTIPSAVESMKMGAFDYIPKPFIPEQIRQVLSKLQKSSVLEKRVENLESQVAGENPTLLLESSEPSVQKAYQTALKAASSDANILLLGPSGTGKSILARNIHENSSRREERFVTINCPSLSKELLEGELFGHIKGTFTGAVRDTWGKVKAADGGTLFLDEIGELPLEIQPKLLRLLQDREYERVGETRTRRADVRVIAATNRDLKKEVEEHRFREDLYYRLKVIAVELPSLAERSMDLIPIAERYLSFYGNQLGKTHLNFHEDTVKALVDYAWPGNLRELRNVVERAIILCNSDTITPDDLPEEFHDAEPTGLRPGSMVTLDELEAEHIKRVVAKTESLEEASQILGIDPATLYRKRKKLGMN